MPAGLRGRLTPYILCSRHSRLRPDRRQCPTDAPPRPRRPCAASPQAPMRRLTPGAHAPVSTIDFDAIDACVGQHPVTRRRIIDAAGDPVHAIEHPTMGHNDHLLVSTPGDCFKRRLHALAHTDQAFATRNHEIRHARLPADASGRKAMSKSKSKSKSTCETAHGLLNPNKHWYRSLLSIAHPPCRACAIAYQLPTQKSEEPQLIWMNESWIRV